MKPFCERRCYIIKQTFTGGMFLKSSLHHQLAESVFLQYIKIYKHFFFFRQSVWRCEDNIYLISRKRFCILFHIIRHTEHRPTKCRFAAGHVFNKLNKAQSHQNLLLVLRLVCSEENCNHLDTSLAYWVSRLLPHDQSLTQRCIFPTICFRFPVYLHYSYPIKAKRPPPKKNN